MKEIDHFPNDAKPPENDNALPSKSQINSKVRQTVQILNILRAQDQTSLLDEDTAAYRVNMLRFPTVPNGHLLWQFVEASAAEIRANPRYFRALLHELVDGGYADHPDAKK